MKRITLSLSLLIIAMISMAQFNAVKHKTLKYARPVCDLEFSLKGNYFALTVEDNTVELYDKNFNKLWSHKGNSSNYAGTVSFSPDEKFMAFSRYKTSNDIAILRLSDMKIIKTFSDHSHLVFSVCFSPDGKFFASGSRDNTIKIYKKNEDNFELLKTISEHSDWVRSVCFSPDGKFLASGSDDKTVKIYKKNGDNFELLKTISEHTNLIFSVCFSPDSKFLASGSSDNTVKIYKKNNDNFGLLKTISDHTNFIYSVCFSPDGKFLASGSWDKTVKIYKKNNDNFESLETTLYNTSYVKNVCFSPDGKFLASGFKNGTAIIYKLRGVGSSNNNIITVDKTPPEITIIKKEKKHKPTILDKTPPEIIITSPEVSRGLKPVVQNKEITIQGQVNDASGILEVLVNGEEAFVENNKFSKNIFLAYGENTFTVSATDIKQNTNTETFTIIRKSGKKPAEINLVEINSDTFETGEYYALIIGVSEYEDTEIPDLKNEPTKDATKFSNILNKKYSFEKENITLLLNPTRKQIIREFLKLKKIITKQDNLIIFYAGHGDYDKESAVGYWIPANAENGFPDTYIYNTTLSNNIKSIKSKHTLLISDACFSGSIFKKRELQKKKTVAYKKKHSLKSRNAITSGGIKTVPNKSVFFKYLLQKLENNKQKYMSASELFGEIEIPVGNNSPNTPQFGDILNVGDEGGDFIFKLKK